MEIQARVYIGSIYSNVKIGIVIIGQEIILMTTVHILEAKIRDSQLLHSKLLNFSKGSYEVFALKLG